MARVGTIHQLPGPVLGMLCDADQRAGSARLQDIAEIVIVPWDYVQRYGDTRQEA